MTRTREYKSWQAMKARCLNPHNKDYENYGAKGIKPCDDWLAFEPFFADTETRPPGCSLDRIDPNGNYEPGNVRWADAKTQRQNQRPRRTKRRERERAERLSPPLDDPPF